MASPLDQPERRKREDAARRIWYPTSEWRERTEAGARLETWQVIIEPVPPPDELAAVLADLHRDGYLNVEPGGRLRHDPRCHAAHKLPDPLRDIAIPSAAFLVEAAFHPAPRYPVVRVLDPEVSRRTYPDHPHFYHPDVVCPFFPGDGTWRWSKDLVVDYFDHVAVWLVKSSVWLATRARTGIGTWIGPDVDHDPRFLLRVVDRRDPCPCASGHPYGRCCQRVHLAIVNGDLILGNER